MIVVFLLALGMVTLILVRLSVVADRVLSGKTPKAVEPPDSVFTCAAFEQRLFEQRLIDAGISTSLSRCNDDDCLTCHPRIVLSKKATNELKPYLKPYDIASYECSICYSLVHFANAPNHFKTHGVE